MNDGFRWPRVYNRDELEAFYRSIMPAIREAARQVANAMRHPFAASNKCIERIRAKHSHR
jgi:hypothetical protein